MKKLSHLSGVGIAPAHGPCGEESSVRGRPPHQNAAISKLHGRKQESLQVNYPVFETFYRAVCAMDILRKSCQPGCGRNTFKGF